ncbi:heptaprenyl diphosphate synthase [Geosporobacter subterraneus DSM 17957]|uniref:Heptaprenyl diphosphate synthase n=1 Tax=Geosporobacter subterraneus DSM 17957 TaxID=1121919 RepID=A0A1M6N1P8_9FIRM|nr:polyprenyl synthetase family protein [Geosporobacter subterraneus]SHJ89639.1 heptaprenyl diphosphate synthase [Geosporobacter subterraneus DSM 17957]
MSYWNKYPNIQKEMDKVEEILADTVKSRRKIVQDASMDLIQAGGKRIRPALTIISAQFGQYESDKVTTLAAALELFHTATLIHDDIIDNAKTRRGIETAQSKYGKDIAVYTGDYLFSKAFLLVSRIDGGQKVVHLSRFIKAICEGEIEQHAAKYNSTGSIVTYLKRIKYKTALLFALCCQVGAEAAECSPKTIRSLRRYGMSMGTAFQLKDDLLDLTGDEKITGKPVGSDIVEGVYTMPLLYTLRNNSFRTKTLEVLNKTSLSFTDIAELVVLIKEAGGIEYTRDFEKKYYHKARQSLKQLRDHPNVAILDDLIREMEIRVK